MLNLDMFKIMVLCIVLGFAFSIYVKPQLNTIDSFKKNDKFHKYLNILHLHKNIDIENYRKFRKKLHMFFNVYLKSHNHNANENTMIKLKKYKSKTMKYLNRIPFKIPNDVELSKIIYDSIYNINNILEAYLFECSERLNVFYNSAFKHDTIIPSNTS